MNEEGILILIGLITIIILIIVMAIYAGTGTEANNYYYHLNDAVSAFVIPYIMR